jgi:hypothetical protein
MSSVLEAKTNSITDDYEILEELGLGVSGYVKACKNRKTGVKYALKVI